MREAWEDPNLADVKAVLRKLQRLDVVSGEPQPSPDWIVPRPPKSVPPAGSGKRLLSIFKRTQAAFSIRSVRPRVSQRSLVFAAAALTLIACASVLAALYKAPNTSAGIEGEIPSPVLDKKREEHSPMLDKKNEVILLTEARRLIGEGDVESAQKRLMQGGPEARAEIAFLLAQTFDPNYLRSLPASNSLPDRVQAERWYKKWYELAVNSGLEMDSGRLQRIIKAMR
jgi:hypothetical protein